MKIKKYFLLFGVLLLTACFSKELRKPLEVDPFFPSSDLVNKAMQVRENSYSPYSQYKVGAALRTADGKIFIGTNVENAAYGSTICAERSALVSAISNGSYDIEAIAVVTKDGGSPCGSCRQMLNEFNPNIIVIIADEKGEIKKQCKLSELLTDAFGPKNISR